MFFGTPHKGSAIASFASILGKALSGASLGTHTNTQLVKDLERHSFKLEQVSDTFLQNAHHLRVITFYELNKMDYMSTLVVDKESAVTRLRGETSVPLNGDHRTICRFSSRSDKELGLVLGNLSYLVEQATSSRDQTNEDRLLRALATSNPDLHKARNPRPVKGTCSWILEHPTFKTWLEEKTSALLWLSADPGCGKSVLATFLTDHLRSDPDFVATTNVCYFFFKSDNDEQRDAVYGMQAILTQLFQLQRGLWDKAAKVLAHERIESINALWHTLITAVKEKNARDTVCILDGFDECEPDSRKTLTRLLSQFFAPPKDPKARTETELTRLKFFISSRPENSLKIAFDRTRSSSASGHSKVEGAPCSMIRLRGEDETDAISRDISLVIDAEIDDIVELGLPEELLEDVRLELVARADRTFLWVTLILELLKERVEAGASRRELHDILRSRSIDSIYAGLLSARPDAPKARKMLSLILVATRPLSVEELSIALAVKPEHDTFEVTNSPKRPGMYSFKDIEDELVYPFENHIKALCGHFIRIIRNQVYFVHETAREFLLETKYGQSDLDDAWFSLEDDEETIQGLDTSSTLTKGPTATWQGSFSLLDCHAICLEVCVTFIYATGKDTRDHRIGEPSRRTAPFLDYAAAAWTAHFSHVRDELEPSNFPYYQNLCHPRFLGFARWLEIWAAAGNDMDGGREMYGAGAKGAGADDDVQDHYVRLFKMEPESAGQLGIASASNIMQSNPTALDSHNFPVETGANGWVSVNFDRATKMYDDVLGNPWGSPRDGAA